MRRDRTKKLKADLHMHSIHSNDGEHHVSHIIELCIEGGVDTFSVTDHNCVGGSREAAQLLQDKEAINFIPGIEIDCNYRGMDLHLLGYQVDLESADFDRLESDVRQRHMDAIPLMIRNLERLGIHMDRDELMQISGDEPPSAELFAELLLQKPEQQSNPRLKPYFPGGERSDMPLINFYLDFFAQVDVPEEIQPDEYPLTIFTRDRQWKPLLATDGNQHSIETLIEKKAVQGFDFRICFYLHTNFYNIFYLYR